jgi:hypothetical protein
MVCDQSSVVAALVLFTQKKSAIAVRAIALFFLIKEEK